MNQPPLLSITSPHEPRGKQAWLVALSLASCFLLVPIVSIQRDPPSVFGAVWFAATLGCILAQGNLLAAWVVWSDGPFLRRLARHWLLASGLCLIWLLGAILVMPPGAFAQTAAIISLHVPLVSLAAQFPLWLARWLFGWRIVLCSAGPPAAEPPLTIRDLMLATLLVAVALAIARLTPFNEPAVRWPVWAAAFLIASFISTIALLPAGVLLLEVRRWRRALLLSCLYAASWLALQWSIVLAIWYYGLAAVPPWQAQVGLSALMIAFAGTLMLTAAIARDRGYRLVRGRRAASW